MFGRRNSTRRITWSAPLPSLQFLPESSVSIDAWHAVTTQNNRQKERIYTEYALITRSCSCFCPTLPSKTFTCRVTGKPDPAAKLLFCRRTQIFDFVSLNLLIQPVKPSGIYNKVGLRRREFPILRCHLKRKVYQGGNAP